MPRPPPTITGRTYDISRLDGRFIIAKPVTSSEDRTLNVSVVLNWFTELEAGSP
jgi:hypothetical protein